MLLKRKIHPPKPVLDEDVVEALVSDVASRQLAAPIYPQAPERYRLNDQGVFGRSDKRGEGWMQISNSPFWLEARLSNLQKNEWSYLVGYVDPDGEYKEVTVPADELVDERGMVCRRFARLGVGVLPRKGPDIYLYLNAFEAVERHYLVDRVGWIGQQFAFMLPDRVIGQTEGDEGYILQDQGGSSREVYSTRGNHEGWLRGVADVAEVEPMFLFSLFVGFTSPLLELLGLDGGGFMLAGSSSKGKSTALGITVTPWANGADPASSSESSIVRMNATANGMEGVARKHSSTAMAMDELGSYQVKGFGSFIYDIAGGNSKSVMDSNRELVQRGGWSLAFIATGEMTIKEKLLQNKEPINAGMTVRFIDIQIDFIESDNDRAQEEMRVIADGLKTACASHYGTAGPMFLERLIASYDSRKEAKKDLLNRLDTLTKTLAVEGMGSEQVRAVRRFALVALAGILASEYGVINTPLEKILAATTAMMNAWAEERETISDGERAIANISGYLFRNQHRFLDIDDDSIQGNLAGYTKDDMFLLTDQAFLQGVGDLNANIAKKALFEAGYLHVQGQSATNIRYKSRYRLPGTEVRRPFYCIKMSILNVDGIS